MNTSSSDQLWVNLPLYIVYIIQGSITAIGNLIIVLAIGRYEALRCSKEYVIMSGLSLADGLGLAGTFCSGIYRIMLLITNKHNGLKTAWECMLLPQSIFWSMGVQLQSIMLMVVSLDRLAAVICPLQYLGWTVSYAHRFVGAVYLYQSMIVIFYYYSAYTKPFMVPATCSIVAVIGATTHRFYYVYYNVTIMLVPVLSVVVYVFVMVILHKHFSSAMASVSAQHPNHQYELKRQRKITVTLSIGALCTFFLYVVPISITLRLMSLGYWAAGFAFASVSNFNAMANILIYPLRHREVLKAIKALLKCRHMPADLKMWNTVDHPLNQVEMNVLPKAGRYMARSAIVKGTTGQRAPAMRGNGENPGPSQSHIGKHD